METDKFKSFFGGNGYEVELFDVGSMTPFTVTDTYLEKPIDGDRIANTIKTLKNIKAGKFKMEDGKPTLISVLIFVGGKPEGWTLMDRMEKEPTLKEVRKYTKFIHSGTPRELQRQSTNYLCPKSLLRPLLQKLASLSISSTML